MNALRWSLVIILLIGASPTASAADPPWYAKQGTWEETLETSREAFEQAQKEKPKAAPLPDFGKSDFTILAWVRTKRGGTILAKAPAQGNWAPQGKSFFIRDGRLTFDIGWVGAARSKAKVADGQWHHVAVAKHKDALRFTIDGEPSGGGSLKFAPDPKGAALKIGFTNPNFPRPSGFRGELDDLRLYRRALSPEEIAAHAEKPQPATAKELVAVWPFEGDLADATDGGHDAMAKGKVRFVKGKVGQALRLDGKAHAVVGGAPDFDALVWPLLERDFGVVRLFDGHSLAGWRRRNKPGHGWGAVWEVTDGAIAGVQEWPGSWGMLATRRAFGDLDLRLEVKTDGPLDAAVLFRESGFARAWQVNIYARDDGDVGGIATHAVPGPRVPARGWEKLWKKDDWNTLRIVVTGDPPTIRTWLNGQPLVKHKCKKTPDLLRPRGPLGLTVTGPQACFKNHLYVRKVILLEPRQR
ncbi:MAG: family 16 glycoside hydrolase [Planctomycetota bacterium]